jgi:hypothetical protein
VVRVLFLLAVVVGLLLFAHGHGTVAFVVLLAAGVVGLLPAGLAMRRAVRRRPDDG